MSLVNIRSPLLAWENDRVPGKARVFALHELGRAGFERVSEKKMGQVLAPQSVPCVGMYKSTHWSKVNHGGKTGCMQTILVRTELLHFFPRTLWSSKF